MKNTPWQHSCCFVKRYMPLEGGCSIRQIIGELDSLAERGYGAIHITAPVTTQQIAAPKQAASGRRLVLSRGRVCIGRGGVVFKL